MTAVAAVLVPARQTAAFWPFSTSADAATPAFVPSAATPALAAATNVDPNPDKGLDASVHTSGNAVIASVGPTGTIADVTNTPPPDRISIYVVRPGDTLSEIAAMFNVSVNTIIWANNLKNARDVHPGDTLVILPVSGLQHTVATGETLRSIAKKYGSDATEIAQYNGLDAGSALAVGSVIIIPGGEIATPAPTRTAKGPIQSDGTIHEPYLGGSGPLYADYYRAPIPGGILTQGLHGWNAVDIAAARGTPIHAAAAGKVIIARNNGAWNGGYGNYVVITHDNGTQTLYAHMSHPAVSSGQTVARGQVIGHVGMTGMTTGAHVHFEIRGAKNVFAATCRVGEPVGLFGCN